jgi:hypothetical protein
MSNLPQSLLTLEKLCDEASPGKWSVEGYDEEPDSRGWWIHNGKVGMEEYAIAVTFDRNPRQENDANFIATFNPTTVRALLTVCRAAAEVLATDPEDQPSDEGLKWVTLDALVVLRDQVDALTAALPHANL